MHRNRRNICAVLLMIVAFGLPCAQAATPHSAIIFIADGMRAGVINSTDTPTMDSIRNAGVKFANSHALFPTFTTANGASIATGHYLGDTSDYSNTIFTGYVTYASGVFGKTPGTLTPFLENDQLLADLNLQVNQPNGYLNEVTLMAQARAAGYNVASVGKHGPVMIQDLTQDTVTGDKSAFNTPVTVIIDDVTGSAAGLPIPTAIQTAMTNAGLALVAPSRGANGASGDNVTPGTLAANVTQQQWFADVATKAILPTFVAANKPFLILFWSRDPDGTQHNQGDSLNTLSPGINGPTSKAAWKNADDNLKQIYTYVTANNLTSSTNLFLSADHGFSTISRHDMDTNATPTTSYAATFVYKRADGSQEVPTGFLPPGFLAIDLAHFLNKPLYDPDSQITVNATKVYMPVDPTIAQQTATTRQHPASGDGLIDGAGTIAVPTDAKVIVCANGGSDLIYLPTPNLTLVTQIVDFLSKQDYVGGIFVDDAYGDVPGALPLSSINMKGAGILPVPAIAVSFRNFALNNTLPTNNQVQVADTGLQQGQGMHGCFGRGDTFNFMAAIGPDFKTNFVDTAPVSNADIAITLANVMGISLPAKGTLVGRVLTEALNTGASVTANSAVQQSKAAANGLKTVLAYQTVGSTKYFDAAGIPGRFVVGAPIFTVGATATPTNAGVGQAVAFTATAIGNGTLTYAWDFGDGTTGTGASVSHAYTGARSVTAMVTVTDSTTNTVSSSVAINISKPAIGANNDSDGDGFSDNVEKAAGSIPTDPNSTPTGASVLSPGSLTVKKVSIKLNFKKSSGNDTISFSGEVPVPATVTSLDGLQVVAVIGDTAIALNLNKSGKGKNGSVSISLGKPKAGVSKFSVNFGKGSFATDLSGYGLTNADAKKATTQAIPFTLIFGKSVYTVTKSVTYTAKTGNSGSAK